MGRPEWEAEYADLFNAHAVRLRRVAWGVCGDWNQAEDVVQTAFVRLYPKFARVRRGDPVAYVRRAVVNECLSRRRRQARELVTSELPEPVVAAHAVDTIDVVRALAGLPDQQRAVVALRYLDDLSVREVAALLDLSEGTVKSHTSRGLATLRDRLSDYVSMGDT